MASSVRPNMARDPPAVNLRPPDQPQKGRLEERNLTLLKSPSNSSNNSRKSKYQGAMNSEISRREEEGNNNNISSDSIRCNQDYNREGNDSCKLKLQHNQFSRSTDEPIETIEGGGSRNNANKAHERKNHNRSRSTYKGKMFISQ